MSTNKNEKNNGGNVDVSSSKETGGNVKTSKQGEAYVPPHRRQRLYEENQNKSNFHTQRSSNYNNNNSHYNNSYFNNQRSKRNDDYHHRKSQSGGYNDRYRQNGPRKSKWKDEDEFFYSRKGEYGSDGLLPQDLRLEEELFGNRVNTGINYEKYNDIPVEAFGSDVPSCISKFTDLPIGPVLQNSINLLKYDTPTPVQQYALPIIYSKRDLMACAQTGMLFLTETKNYPVFVLDVP